METGPVDVERAATPSAFEWWPRGRLAADRVREVLARLRPHAVEPEPYVAGETRLRPLLMRPAVLGFAAVVAIVVGASQPSSPFTLTQMPGSWFFGIPPRPLVLGAAVPQGQNAFVGVLLFYVGMALMLRAWYEILRVTARHPGVPVRKLVPVFVAWALPLLVVAPLLSRDVYSYVAEGEMMSHGISPYSYGPGVLGVNSWVTMVSPLWQNVTSPYGPLFMSAAGATVSLSGHNLLASIVGMRLLALAGVVLMAIFLPRLARSYGFDGSTAFTLAILNPVVLVNLIGGAHNDALMLGLMVTGLSLARSGRHVLGAVIVTLAACVKVPAAVGLVYIAWEWLGDGAMWRDRIRPMISTLLVGGVVMLAVTEVVGLGWGWLGALGNPDTLLYWTTPATFGAIVSGSVLHAFGLPHPQRGLLTMTRLAGALAAGVLGLRLLLRSTSRTSGRALGLTLLFVVILGPVIEPWYIAWGIVLLAAVAEGRTRTFLVVLSCVFSFLGLPGGSTLVNEIGLVNPVLVAGAALPLLAIGGLLLSARVRRLLACTGQTIPQPVPEGSTV